MTEAEDKLKRFAEARQLLTQSAPPSALWFLAGDVPCYLHAGQIRALVLEDDAESRLVCEFLRETGPVFDSDVQLSMELLGIP